VKPQDEPVNPICLECSETCKQFAYARILQCPRYKPVKIMDKKVKRTYPKSRT